MNFSETKHKIKPQHVHIFTTVYRNYLLHSSISAFQAYRNRRLSFLQRIFVDHHFLWFNQFFSREGPYSSSSDCDKLSVFPAVGPLFWSSDKLLIFPGDIPLFSFSTILLIFPAWDMSLLHKANQTRVTTTNKNYNDRSNQKNMVNWIMWPGETGVPWHASSFLKTIIAKFIN